MDSVVGTGGLGAARVVGPASCEVEVTVRYSAVSKMALGATQFNKSEQDQNPKSGNNG